MPYVQVRTTENMNKEKVNAISAKLGPAISIIPGKSESRLMLEVVGDCNLFMAGSDAPAAYVSVLVNNHQESENLKNYSRKIVEVLNEEAGVPVDRIYITHQSVPEWHSSVSLF